MLLEAPTLLFSLYLPLLPRAIETAAIENSRARVELDLDRDEKKNRKYYQAASIFYSIQAAAHTDDVL